MRLCVVSREVAAPWPRACRELAAAGHEVHLLTVPHSGPEQVRALVPGCQVHTVDLTRGPAALPAWRCEPQRHAMAVLSALEELQARHSLHAVLFPEAGGEGAFVTQARQTRGHFGSTVLAVWQREPSPRAPGALLDMEQACVEHLEAVALRGADLVLPPAAPASQLEPLLTQAASARAQAEPPRAPRSTASPAVSILIPHYNLGRYLPQTLRSVREQTFQDYEILLVDDGSTDPHSLQVLAGLEAQEEPRLRVVRKRNGGLGSARNAGLRQARGRWVLPLDADDLLEPTFLAKAVEAMELNPGLAYVTSLVAYFHEDPARPFAGWVPWGLERDALWVENVASTCTALLERQRLEEVGGYDESLPSFEDWDVFCSLAERGAQAAVIPEFLFLYRMRPDSMTRTVATRSKEELIARLVHKHPALPHSPERAFRLQLGEVRRLRQRLLRAEERPLRYQVVDQLNDSLKRLGVLHPALRWTAELASTRGAQAVRQYLRQAMSKMRRL